jgi:hypothetical protein
LDVFERRRDEKDEEGLAKDKIICFYLKSQEEELTDKFVLLEISVYSWIGSVAQAPPVSWTREDE